MESELRLPIIENLIHQPMRQVKVHEELERIGRMDVIQSVWVVDRFGALRADTETACVVDKSLRMSDR